MKKFKIGGLLKSFFLGKRYSELSSIDDQVRYMTMNSIFMVAIIPLVVLGVTMISTDITRAYIDFFIAFLCLLALIMIRSKIPLKVVPIFPVSVFGAYCVYLAYSGDMNLWAAIWLFAFPPIVIFLCRMTVGVIESIAAIIVTTVFLYTPFAPVDVDNEVKSRVILAYILILSLTIIYERISILKDKKEKTLQAQLLYEKNVIQIMKDNIPQGIFLMDTELKILPQYSLPLVSIFSYYEDNLAGKYFLDILSNSLETKQLQILKGYFTMVFSKSKSAKVLESANPLYEFEYKVDNQVKILATKFSLVEEEGSEPVIIGIIQDITREREFEREFQVRKEAQEMEMKNMFDVIQIDPLVFQDFIDDTETNFKYINSLLKDKTLSERQVVTKFFQNIHAIKSNAIILGLESFGNKLHSMEDDIKKILDKDEIDVGDTLKLALDLEQVMQEKDTYIKTIKKIESFKVSNKLDTVLVNAMIKAVEKTAFETNKVIELKPGQIDLRILETKLRRPIKDILFQCVRNSIFHGIEPYDERAKKSKPPKGILKFSIILVDGKADVVFSDDGRGLDWGKLKAKYLEINPGAKNIDKKVLLSSIFLPEFSTSKETTTVAGRGVGLSLVKDLVKENGGSIKVNSTESGLTLKFTFPMPK